MYPKLKKSGLEVLQFENVSYICKLQKSYETYLKLKQTIKVKLMLHYSSVIKINKINLSM